ncbi:hypothetical protein NUH86_21975 [Sphingobium sp. JS3065]|nr:hypothetical protein [Sphingobium sp. JS3065]UZW57376.1 hypothetical protein NUH86_21975 [Sphingobium sp. JS3065]
MNKQRPEPVNGLTLTPPIIQSTGFVKGDRRIVEQAEHRQIDLAMAIIGRRVNQAGNMVPIDEDIATPEIAVQQGGRWMNREQFSEPVRQ